MYTIVTRNVHGEVIDVKKFSTYELASTFLRGVQKIKAKLDEKYRNHQWTGVTHTMEELC